MNSFDNMDIDSMIDDPFKNININEDGEISVKSSQQGEKAHSYQPSTHAQDVKTDSEHTQQNFPDTDHALTFEEYTPDINSKLETIMEIIEHQNNRIEALEEELDLLRTHLYKEEEGKINAPGSN